MGRLSLAFGMMTALSRLHEALLAYLPGVCLALAIALGASLIAPVLQWPAALIVLVCGFALGRLRRPSALEPGLLLAKHGLLKIGIVLLGANISLVSILQIAPSMLAAVPGLVVLTIFIGCLTARVIGAPSSFGYLAGGAVAICGASAALAIYLGLPASKRNEGQLALSIFGVTVLSTVAMIAYPVVLSLLGFDDRTIGLVLGASIHDVAQVVGAGLSVSDDAGELAILVKMVRVLCLPIVVIMAGIMFRDTTSNFTKSHIGIPWFIVGFFIAVVTNATGLISPFLAPYLKYMSTILLLTAIGALAMQIELSDDAGLFSKEWIIFCVPTFLLFAISIAAVRILRISIFPA